MMILHITTHMGGGVGRFLSDALISMKDTHNIHRLILLERPINTNFIDKCHMNDVPIDIAPSEERIIEIINEADVVVIHWWHHPIMTELLANFPLVSTKLILMSHISGCHYPNLPQEFIKKFKRVIFTSQYSLENKTWNEEAKQQILQMSDIVYGLGKFSNNKKSDYNFGQDFVVGYVGTFAKSKLHPKFVHMCKILIEKIPNIRFVMVGDTNDSKEIISDATNLSIANYFEFTGFVEDVNKEFSRFDVFGYPLNSKHFGTTENSLLEAIAFGIPTVCMNQNTEKFIINHKVNGLLAENEQDYINLIMDLHEARDLREDLGKNGARDIRSKFLHEKNIKELNEVISKTIESKESITSFADFMGDSPWEWFLSFIGEGKNLFDKDLTVCENKESLKSYLRENHILTGMTKSSIKHFNDYFPEDESINQWLEIVKELEMEA